MINEAVKSLEIKTFSNTDYYVRWKVNSICNFRCHYCYQGHYADEPFTKADVEKYNEINKQTVEKFNRELETKDKIKIKLSIMGGEPTLSDLPYIFKNLNLGNNKIKASVATNFSCSEVYLDRLREAMESQPNLKAYLRVSVHETETDPYKLMEKIIKHKDIVKTCGIVVYDEYTAKLYDELYSTLTPEGVWVSSPQLCSDEGDFVVPREIADSLNYHTDERYKFILNGNQKVARYEFLKDYYGAKRACFEHYTCWPVSKILSNGSVRHCPHEKGNFDNEILFSSTRVCPYPTCDLCNISKVERLTDET